MSFTHLHNHTAFSVLDGHGTIKNYVAAAKADGQKALAITDHGTMAGAIEFYTECREAGIKPIIGCELYVDLDVQEEKFPFHLTILAADLQGYRDLVNVNTAAHKAFYYRPRVSLRALMDEGLMAHWIVLTGCPSSPINKMIRADKPHEARLLLQALSKASAGAAIEIMYHTSEDKEFRQVQSDLLHAQFALSKQEGNPLVLTNDCHYVGADDERIHQEFLKATEGRIHGIEFDGNGFFLQTNADMRRISDYLEQPGSYDNSGIIGDLCNVDIPEVDSPKWYVPSPFPDPEAEIHNRCSEIAHDDNTPPEYGERYEQEMAVLTTSAPIMNSYLVAADLIDWCKEQGIPATGRGSMAGSLVSYLLGITSEDPIKWNLSFKRAVNPARLTIPDFDIDVSSARRGDVLAYLASKYPHSAPIASYSERGLRGATRMVMRALNYTAEDTNIIAKLLPDDGTIDLEPIPERAREVVAGYIGLYGNLTVHPAGILISGPDRPLEGIVPMCWVPSSKQLVAQFNMYSLKKIDMFKLDVLGLSTLDSMARMEELSGESPPTEYTDEAVFELLSRGMVCEVFQLDGYAARSAIRSLGITSFEDIVAINALVRPGASAFIPVYRTGDSTLIDQYPNLDSVIRITRGLILYQEQVMAIAEILAGFDDLLQDDIKEAIKYFRADVFEKLEPTFMEGCAKNGHDGTLIWNAIKAFAGYAFNKCVSGDTILDDGRTIKQWYEEGQGAQLRSLSGNRLIDNEVIRVYSTGYKRTLQIEWASGSLKCTPEHKIWTQRGWVVAGELTPKDYVYAAQGVQADSRTPRKDTSSRNRQKAGRGNAQEIKRKQKEILGQQESRRTICNSYEVNVFTGSANGSGEGKGQVASGQSRMGALPHAEHAQETSKTMGRCDSGDPKKVQGGPKVSRGIHCSQNEEVSRQPRIPKLGNRGIFGLPTLLSESERNISTQLPKRYSAHGGEENPGRSRILRSNSRGSDDRIGRDETPGSTLLGKVCNEQEEAANNYGQRMEFIPVQRITDCGSEETFDIEMSSPFNSYLANGIIVHNSHAVTYAATAYKMAWYKKYHPAAFFAAIYDHAGEPVRAILESLQLGVEWQMPDINHSGFGTSYSSGKITLGLGAIKGIGTAVADAVVSARASNGGHLANLNSVVKRQCNVRHKALLQDAGALGSLGKPGDPSKISELLGFNPVITNSDIATKVTVYETNRIGGFIVSYREHVPKSGGKLDGKKMGFITLVNAAGEFDVTMFPGEWKRFKKAIQGKPSMLPVILYGQNGSRGFVAQGGEWIE